MRLPVNPPVTLKLAQGMYMHIPLITNDAYMRQIIACA